MPSVIIISAFTCISLLLYVLTKYERIMFAPADNGWVLYVIAELGPAEALRLAADPSVREALLLWQLREALPRARESGNYGTFDAAMSRLLATCRPAVAATPTTPAERTANLAPVRAV
jgi:hypothetical protein